MAQPVIGVPHDWQMGFPKPFTPVMDRVESLHDLLLVIISLISAFVLGLLLYVMWRFHAARHPQPSTVTHNTVLEILWTIVPILILVVIAVPSFRLLYYGDKAPDAAMTIKVTGHQWYWSYE
jgi:cytochrome c oxidase subunit 2